MPKQKTTAQDALHLLARLDEAEQHHLLERIISDRAAPLHGGLDMILKSCLHAMKSAVHVFVSGRDKPSDGGRLWAGLYLGRLKERNRWGWDRLYKELVNDPEAVRAVRILSPKYSGGPLTWAERERVRKAIRDLVRHAKTKAEKAEQVYQLVLLALPPWVRETFPGIESYLRIF
jgi:hypothetical protein